MSAINELREGLAHTETAQFVTTMLRDISATRLQSIRAAYEANEKYFLELHELMQLLHTYAVEKGIELPVSEKQLVYVALTSNRRFYGTLNDDVINQLRKVQEANPEARCVVLGQTGKQILERNPLASEVLFIQFEKDEPTPDEIHAVVTKLVPFAEVVVIHPTYINAFEQKAKVTDVTHVPHQKEGEELKTLEYLIEPDIPAMLAFFKNQIRFVLFDRIVLETRLALTGARLMKMQRARERTEEMLVDERRVIHKEISTMQSMRLLETFTGFRNENAL
jgi:F0F1-type ATP synthase gamma subunit